MAASEDDENIPMATAVAADDDANVAYAEPAVINARVLKEARDAADAKIASGEKKLRDRHDAEKKKIVEEDVVERRSRLRREERHAVESHEWRVGKLKHELERVEQELKSKQSAHRAVWREKEHQAKSEERMFKQELNAPIEALEMQVKAFHEEWTRSNPRLVGFFLCLA